MAVSIERIAAAVTRVRNQIEAGPVDLWTGKLVDTLSRAEVQLGRELGKLHGLDTAGGRIIRSTRNIERAERIAERAVAIIQKRLVAPGQAWADGMLDAMADAGSLLARANLENRWISQTAVDAVFAHLPEITEPILRVGRDNAYTIMKTIGADVQAWFRGTLLDAVVEELPIQGAGSLAVRIAESGRIAPLSWKTKTGRTITRDVSTRANAIARVESAKVMNAVHEALAGEALGEEALFINANPEDERTTPICMEASQQPPMTLEGWSRTYGRPPRLKPFHLCRSVLIAGKRSWFDLEEPPAPPPKPQPKTARKPRTPAVPKPSRAEAAAAKALEAQRAADLKMALDKDAGWADRLAAYSRIEGDEVLARVNQIGGQAYLDEQRLAAEYARELARSTHSKIVVHLGPGGTGPGTFIDREVARLQLEAIQMRHARAITEAREYMACGKVDKVAAGVPGTWDTPKGPPMTLREGLKEAREWFRTQFADGPWQPGELKFKVMFRKTNTRAFAKDSYYGNPAIISVGPHEQADTWVHEIGHHVEHTSNRGLASSTRAVGRSFRNYRVSNSEGELRNLKKIKDVAPGYGYKGDEQGFDDRFQEMWKHIGNDGKNARRAAEFGRYTGKHYGSTTNATEILSMGLEAMFEDPVGFALADPEYFKFILGVMRGTFK